MRIFWTTLMYYQIYDGIGFKDDREVTAGRERFMTQSRTP